MNGTAGASHAAGFDEQALMRGVGSVSHPLTRALLALTFTTGLIDAASYLGLGKVFTANMTGNVVLLGFGIAGSGGLPVIAPIVSLAAYLVGSGAGGVLVRRLGKRHPALVSGALTIEVLLVTASAIVAGVARIRPGDAYAYAIIALLALAAALALLTALVYVPVAARRWG